MTNYICINGNKTELTEEQLKQLGIELPKVTPFTRSKKNKKYFSIMQDGKVDWHYENADPFDERCFDVANYCTDKAMMEQRALHETLNRLLWRYSMEHDGDKIDLVCVSQTKWYIYYDTRFKEWNSGMSYSTIGLDMYFHTEEAANNAIKEIIKPFMKAHPEFKF